MQSDKPLDINYTKFTLKNGIKCVLYPRPEIHSVTIHINVNVGGLDEDANTNGIAHFIEHVAHDGTKELPTWQDIDKYTNEYSGRTNAYTTLDHTRYYGTFPSQYLDQAMFYFSQLALHVNLKESDVDKERSIIIDEKKRDEDDVGHNIIRNIKDNRFETPDSPFSYELIGTKPNLEIFNAENLKDFYEKYYQSENIEIYIVGNFEVAKAKEILNKYFYNGTEDKKSGPKPAKVYKSSFPEYAGFKINANQKLDIDQYYLTIDFPGFEFTSTSFEDRYKLSFVRTMTASADYGQSVLWKRLREELGIVYGVEVWNYDMISRKIVGIETSFDKKHLETILKEIYTGINKIKDKEIDDGVFQARKKKMIDTQLMELDRPENALDWVETYEDELEEHGRGLMLNDYLEFVKGLTFDDVIKTSKQIYNWDMAQIGIVSKDDPEIVKKEVEEMWRKIKN